MNIALRVLNDVCCSNYNAEWSKPAFPLSVTQSKIVSYAVDCFFFGKHVFKIKARSEFSNSFGPLVALWSRVHLDPCEHVRAVQSKSCFRAITLLNCWWQHHGNKAGSNVPTNSVTKRTSSMRTHTRKQRITHYYPQFRTIPLIYR